jgi:hypothetical protein
MPTLTDGWNDLPSGGVVQVKDGIPLQVSDKGRWNLEETQILAEAAKLTGSKITWRRLERWRRWQEAGLLSIFSESNRYRWSCAEVVREVCELCGSEVGSKWVRLQGQDVWSCESCAAGGQLSRS